MTAEELQSSLALAGYPTRMRGREEVLLQSCLYCGNDRWNLELNPEKGVFHCWACRASGRLDGLLSQQLGQDIFVPVRIEQREQTPVQAELDGVQRLPLAQVESAWRYLERRGLPLHEAERYGVTVGSDPTSPLYLRILFPVLDFWSGRLLAFQGRAYLGGTNKYWLYPNNPVLAGLRQRNPRTPVIIVEGFFDGIAVHRAGYQALILLGTDNQQIEQFAARLDPETPLFILLDGDAEAQAERLYWRLSPLRPLSIIDLLPGIDPGMLRPEVIRRLVELTGRRF